MPERCTHVLTAFHCELPAGHEGDHMAEGDLPPDLNRFLGRAWDEMVAARIRYQRAMGYARILLLLGGGLTLGNIIAMIIRTTGA